MKNFDSFSKENERTNEAVLSWPRLLAASDDPNTIRAGRRRKPTQPSGSGERAEAPERERQQPRPSSGTSGGYSSSGGGGYSASGGGLGNLMGGGGSKTPLWLILIVIVVMVCLGGTQLGDLFGGTTGGDLPGGDLISQPTEAPQVALPNLNPTNTPRPRPTAFSSTAGQGDTWTVMLYQDADDKVLEQDIYIDLNEAEKVGSTDHVTIVAQMDRFRGGYSGDGDWTSTKRLLITQDDNLNRVASQQIADLGEANMASGDTLVDFVTWAVQAYPADKYALIMSDHGMGWPGGWSDPTSTEGGDRRVPLSSALGDQLYLMELEDALARAVDQTGIGQFELIGMDACLMSHLEVYSALQPYTRFAVASQETEPSLGWAYSSFLAELAANPNMDGAALGQTIVNSYIVDDQRIIDDQARAEFLRPNTPFGGSYSAAQVTNQLARDITIATIDMQALPALIDSVNDFAYYLQNVDQSAVAKARSYAQSFTNIFGKQVPPAYIDLGHFVQLTAQATRDNQVAQLGQQVMNALGQTVIAEKHGANKSGATGISIYFPNSTLYSSPVTGAQSYVAVSDRFAGESLWDDFLAYHYIGRSFQPAQTTRAIPETNDRVSAPGAEGGITLSPLTLSSPVAAPGSPILLSTNVQGSNIGFIKLFVGLYDPNANSLYVADSDYLESSEVREVNGVYYPVWDEDGNFNLEFEWDPILFVINDGSKSAVALFNPESYGKSAVDAVYTVEAVYTFADDGEQRRARLYFRDGLLRQVFGFTGSDTMAAPREIIPQAGDQVTILEKWMDLDANGRVTEIVEENGETLTFGSQTFTWESLDAPVGNYVVGFIVEDLDGNVYPVYANVEVQ